MENPTDDSIGPQAEKTDNELIAEFMGLVRKEADRTYNKAQYYLPEDNKRYKGKFVGYYDSLRYHEFWDWLMPVVEKIESLQYKKYLYVINGYTFVINGRCAEVMDIERDTITKQQVGESKIEATYKAVIEFIKWYNTQPKQL